MTQPIPSTDDMLRGSSYRQTHAASVTAILGHDAPPVSSRGNRFYNVDRWTIRVFTREMCAWAKANKGCVPTRNDVAKWVNKANAESIPHREIVIAATPMKLSVRVALGLTGGAYHEAFHTYYSCRRQLTVTEMCRIVLPRWAKVPDWSRFYVMLQEWSNIAEDIRIERNGRVEFPGVEVPLHDLQDFILHQEAQGIEQVRAHGGKGSRGALSVVMGVYRDVGLGYSTTRQQAMMDSYREENPDAVKLVIGEGRGNPGPLTGLLKHNIGLGDKDDTACIAVALDVVGILYNVSSEEDPANDDQDDENQPGGDHKTVCPSCQAPGSKLVVRPKADGNGGKVKGKGILTCTVCGHQEEVDLDAKDQNKQDPQQQGKQDPKFQPKFEGFDPEDFDGQGGGSDSDDKDGDQGDDNDDQNQGGGASKGSDDGDEDQDGSGSGSDSDGDEGDESQDGSSGSQGDEDGSESDPDGSGQGNEDGDEDGDQGGSSGSQDDGSGDDAGASGQDGDDGDDGDDGSDAGDNDDGSGEGQGQTGDDSQGSDDAEGGTGAGGHQHHQGPIDGNQFEQVADDSLEDGNKGADLLDNNSVLEGAVEEEVKAEEKREGGVKSGEKAWRPYDPGLDEVVKVQPSKMGKAHDRDVARQLYASVKDEATYLRARLRQIVRALEMVDTVHGLPKGKLSTRMLVDTKVTLMGGQVPKRAYQQTDQERDTSLAAAIVIDESGSMSSKRQDSTRVMCAITEPLDALGCAVQASGFRDGSYRGGYRYGGGGPSFHRANGIVHDIFKHFDEPLRAVQWRFANTIATGGTPMSDGVQFALDALSLRPEGHRVMFVVTDGQPNGSHLPIIKRQCRLAREAGIHIIGVGLGRDSRYVKDVFPDAVWTEKISDMPKALIAKLNELIDTRVSARKRGRKVRS